MTLLWPRATDGPQRVAVHLRVDRGRIHAPVPQHPADFRQGCPIAEHVGCRGVAESVGPQMLEPAAIARGAHDLFCHGCGHIPVGRLRAQEQVPRLGRGAPPLQIRHDRLAYNLWKRKRVQAPPFSADQNLAPRPVQVIEGQRCCLDSSQAETEHEDQHGIVASPETRATIAGEQESIRFFWGQSLGQSREPPAHYRGRAPVRSIGTSPRTCR